MLDLGARCEYYGVRRFQPARSYTGVPDECTVIATYERTSPFPAATAKVGAAANAAGGRVDDVALTHPRPFPDWTTALHMVARSFEIDETRLLETVISRWLGPVRRPARLFPWFAEEFPGADPSEGLALLPEEIVRAVRDDAALTFPDADRSPDGRPLGGKRLSAEARAETARLLGAMRAAWSRSEWLIALDERNRERLISFRDVRFREGRIVKPHESERLHMHNYGRAVHLSEVMRRHLGFTAAAWLIWANAPDPFSEEGLAECAPDRALERVNDRLIDRLQREEAAPALSRELRAELVEWLRALVDGWKRGFWVTFSV